VNLSVIVASGGRHTLGRTVASIVPQLTVNDELLVLVDQRAPWGHASRNRMMKAATGDWLMFMDDDDTYAEGAFDTVRAALRAAPSPAIHVFRMRYADGRTLWQDEGPADNRHPRLRLGNVSTQMVVVPNGGRLGRWNEALYEGDWSFVSECARQLPVEWHEEVIALIRPEG
jgi:glycosyltransferase involved in cell wall biosynthesis